MKSQSLSSERRATLALLESGAVNICPENPVTFSSGLRSPIYVHNMTLNSDLKRRRLILNMLVSLLEEKFTNADTIATTIGGSVPWATPVADQVNLPLIYVRKQQKKYALKNQIEGKLIPGSKVVLIEAAVGTARTILSSVKKIQRAGGQPIGLVSIFNYQLEISAYRFQKTNLICHSLTNLNSLLDTACRYGMISRHNEICIRDWCAKPLGWRINRVNLG